MDKTHRKRNTQNNDKNSILKSITDYIDVLEKYTAVQSSFPLFYCQQRLFNKTVEMTTRQNVNCLAVTHTLKYVNCITVFSNHNSVERGTHR